MTTIAVAVPSRRHRGAWNGWLLSLPTIVVMAALALVPVITILVEAFSGDGIAAVQRLVRTPGFGQMLLNTVEWVLICVVGALVLGVVAALVLDHRRLRLAGLWRSLLLIPWITPGVVTATAWKWLYSRDYGMFNAILESLGIIHQPISWLTNGAFVLPAIAGVQIWASFPFVMLLVSAGLQGVPDELREAARLDGANAVQVFRNVVLPSLRDIAFIVVLIITVWSLNAFVPIWIITQGGPAGASDILPVQLYLAFQNGTSADVSVIALIQLVLSMTVAWFYVQRTRRAEAA